MYAIGFDMEVKRLDAHHPGGFRQAYADIGSVMGEFGFKRVQGSLYVNSDEDMTSVFKVMTTLRSLPWFVISVSDIRAFRVEQWSDFTSVMKAESTDTRPLKT